VPDPHHDILTPEDVVPLFTALAPKERPIFAQVPLNRSLAHADA